MRQGENKAVFFHKAKTANKDHSHTHNCKFRRDKRKQVILKEVAVKETKASLCQTYNIARIRDSKVNLLILKKVLAHRKTEDGKWH
jgi:hypothetical protein